MTLGEIKSYMASLNRQQVRDNVNNIGVARVAHHAEGDDYKQLIREMQSEIEQ